MGFFDTLKGRNIPIKRKLTGEKAMAKTHEDIYEAILIVAKALEPLYGNVNEAVDGVITFSLGNGLFGAPNIFTGLCTPAAKFLKKPGLDVNVTWEHIWGRKNSSIALIEEIRKGRSDKFLINLIKSRCRVTITLKEENQALRPYQNDPDLVKKHPRQVYKAAGLNWVDWIGPEIKVYNISGVVYNTKDDICNEYNISMNQLNYRLGKQAKKWKDWYIERIDPRTSGMR